MHVTGSTGVTADTCPSVRALIGPDQWWCDACDWIDWGDRRHLPPCPVPIIGHLGVRPRAGCPRTPRDRRCVNERGVTRVTRATGVYATPSASFEVDVERAVTTDSSGPEPASPALSIIGHHASRAQRDAGHLRVGARRQPAAEREPEARTAPRRQPLFTHPPTRSRARTRGPDGPSSPAALHPPPTRSRARTQGPNRPRRQPLFTHQLTRARPRAQKRDAPLVAGPGQSDRRTARSTGRCR